MDHPMDNRTEHDDPDEHDDPYDPVAVYTRLLTGISEFRWLELADLYAEDCVVEMPFALPEPVHVQGRELVRQRFTAAADGPFRLRVTDLRLHRTADPEVVIGEFGYDGLFLTTDTTGTGTTGRKFSTANIQVVRVRAGLITATRDYHDHARLEQVRRLS